MQSGLVVVSRLASMLLQSVEYLCEIQWEIRGVEEEEEEEAQKRVKMLRSANILSVVKYWKGIISNTTLCFGLVNLR